MTSTHSLAHPPSRWLFVALAYGLAAAACAVGLSLQMPWLGLTLTPDTDTNVVRVRASQGPGADIPRGAILRSIRLSSQSEALALVADDLIEEPDILPEYAQIDAFMARQTRLATLLEAPELVLEWTKPSHEKAENNDAADVLAPSAFNTIVQARVRPLPRPIRTLPTLFWFQLVVSISGCLIACWVWVLRPHDWGARMFGVTGLLFPVFAMPAAVYSGRELALPGDVFMALSHLNHWGSIMFGAALCGIFLAHPQPLVRPRHLVWPFLVFNLWWLTDVLRISPSPVVGMQVPVMLEMLLAILLAAVQWRRSRNDPIDRASLRWFIVSLLLGSGLFIVLIIATASLGWLPPMPQGYAFGFFLFIYVGIALGLRRYRLFELDEWAFRMLLWIGGALAVVSVDALLILALDWSSGPALGVSLWICGAVYFPARQWLWQRWAHRPGVQLHELMPDVVHIAFQPSRTAQESLWRGLLQRIFDPLHLEQSPTLALTLPRIDEGGLNLQVPACGGIPAQTLRYPARGQRLFSSKDVAFVGALTQLLDQAESSRDAQERGARDERKRIARDMHDDVGARLLMLMHRAHSPELADLARAAMHDLRTALHVLDAHEIPLVDALADWRAEATVRCDATGVRLRWSAPAAPVGELASRQKAVLERALREGLSNALRHAKPERVDITVGQEPGWLSLSLANDGTSGESANPTLWREGRGLRGMRQRLEEYGAEMAARALPDGRTEVSLRLPMSPANRGDRGTPAKNASHSHRDHAQETP